MRGLGVLGGMVGVAGATNQPAGLATVVGTVLSRLQGGRVPRASERLRRGDRLCASQRRWARCLQVSSPDPKVFCEV